MLDERPGAEGVSIASQRLLLYLQPVLSHFTPLLKEPWVPVKVVSNQTDSGVE